MISVKLMKTILVEKTGSHIMMILFSTQKVGNGRKKKEENYIHFKPNFPFQNTSSYQLNLKFISY